MISDAKRTAIKHEQLGGEAAAVLWGDALTALHAYAKASGCPLGADVGAWFLAKRDACQAAMSAALRGESAD